MVQNYKKKKKGTRRTSPWATEGPQNCSVAKILNDEAGPQSRTINAQVKSHLKTRMEN